jgi:hypothetical protein
MIVGTQNVRTLALMFIVLIYLMFGAAVFNACKYWMNIEILQAFLYCLF